MSIAYCLSNIAGVIVHQRPHHILHPTLTVHNLNRLSIIDSRFVIDRKTNSDSTTEIGKDEQLLLPSFRVGNLLDPGICSGRFFGFMESSSSDNCRRYWYVF